MVNVRATMKWVSIRTQNNFSVNDKTETDFATLKWLKKKKKKKKTIKKYILPRLNKSLT